MHILVNLSQLRTSARKVQAALLITSLAVCSPGVLFADFVLVGDTDPASFPDNAGSIGGDLTVGVTGVGGLFMDLAPPLAGPLMALDSVNGIIGDEVDAIGAATFDDFGVVWNIETQLTVGREGQGFLDLFDSASVNVGDSTAIGITIIGDEPTGRGDVTVNGVGTLFSAGNLSVGEAGLGTVNVNSRATLRSEVTLVGSVDDTGDGLVTLTGRGTRWSVRDTMTVGGLASLSHGKIEIQNEALLQIEDTATMTLNSRGTVDLTGGTLRMQPQGTNVLTNNGLIQGDGFIDGGMVIGPLGELRNASALVQSGSTVTRQRENLIIAEAVTNDGTIQSLGGSMEFESLVTNNLEIIARDAEMHFRAGVANAGVISVGGDSTLHGTITTAGGSLFVLSDSESLVVGDLVFTASSILGLAVGEDAGTLDVTGAADLSGALLTLDYSAGVAPVTGDSYQIFQADGGISGFANTVVAGGGVLWDVTQIGTDTLIATFNGAVTMPVGGDVNGDGIVDGLDIMIWENNFPIASGATKGLGDADGDGDVDTADFFKMLRDFGVLPVPPISAASAVPEPSTLTLALLTFVCCPRRRKHSRAPLRVV